MQIRNNYDREVFNGAAGVIERVDLEALTLSVRYDGRVVEYDVTELDELVPAYATTIHKSQGSEYPIEVMPLLMTHYVMLQRNLVYTGVTRAKRVLIVVGISKGQALSENEQRYVVGILLRWIDSEVKMIEISAETIAGDENKRKM